MHMVAGLHHVTAFAGSPTGNYDFYTRVLGLRMVKQTVNFDNPKLYHLYYGNVAATPGTLLTFFPNPGMVQGQRGCGEAGQIDLAIPASSIDFWIKRFEDLRVIHSVPHVVMGEPVISFSDPDGMSLSLVGRSDLASVVGRDANGIPAGHSIRCLSGVHLFSKLPSATMNILKALGFQEDKDSRGHGHQVDTNSGISRWRSTEGDVQTRIDLKDASQERRHIVGAGSVHHIAISASSDEEQSRMVESVKMLGISVTEQKDRNYFRSVYFRDPGGVLFEIATRTPGFCVDEPSSELGEKLMLPAWLEASRTDIELALPSLDR